MRTIINRTKLAGFGGLPPEVAEVCQRVLATREELAAHLCHNPELTTSVWLKLWGAKRPPADQAKALVSRPLDPELRAVVIRRETRTTVLAQFLDHNRLDLDEQQLLAGNDHAGELLLEHRWLDHSLRKPIALRVKGLHLLEDLAYAPLDDYSDEEIRALLLTYGQWVGIGVRGRQMSVRHALLRVLFGRRPQTIDTVLSPSMPVDSHLDELLTSAAGSANLTGAQARAIARIDAAGTSSLSGDGVSRLKYCLLALLANPRCPHDVATAFEKVPVSDLRNAAKRRLENPVITESFSAVVDDAHLTMLVRRASSYSGDYGYRPGRPVELVDLARNPALGAERSAQVLGELHGSVDPRLLDAHRAEIAALHPDADLPVATAATPSGPQNAATPQYLQDALTLAAERLGTDPVRWETLIGLLDDYEGEFAELVELAENI